jgi:MSHA biogenesis protein MshE
MVQRRKIRLGELLVENRVISIQQLEAALADQKKSGHKLGRILIDKGYINEDQLVQSLSKQVGNPFPFVDLAHYKLDPEVAKMIPEIHARRLRAVALKVEANGVLVGMSDPTNIFAFDELALILGKPVNLAVVREADLLKTIDEVYRRTEQIAGFAQELKQELSAGDTTQELVATNVADAPVVKLLQSLFEDALQIKASDIHIEPDEAVLRIRQRVDGVLQEHVLNEKRIAASLVLRLKLIAGLDISEKRLPQDGRFSIKVKGRVVDVRISSMPVQYGESVVMRLLDQSQGVLNLDQLGMPEEMRERFKRVIVRPHGMVLVTGPTGSGKTTTLYSALQLLNSPENKIITVEDPVEYRLPRVNQVQVHANIGLTFARVLRSALRQDPDIILIGEMRDEETAQIGLRAAMTGHLVLSTLHTNDAVSTVSRLLDMGIAGYLLVSALNAILAQRLVRRVCVSCQQPAPLSPQAQAWLHAKTGTRHAQTKFMRGAGCHHCNNTGYSGRIGVYELLELTEQSGMILSRGDSATFAAYARSAEGYRPLEQMALNYAIDGITTIDEVMRVSADTEGLESVATPAAAAQ